MDIPAVCELSCGSVDNARLNLQVYAEEVRAGDGGTIDIRRIAVHTLIDVALEMVEQVLHAERYL